jgi:hypothetical protein
MISLCFDISISELRFARARAQLCLLSVEIIFPGKENVNFTGTLTRVCPGEHYYRHYLRNYTSLRFAMRLVINNLALFQRTKLQPAPRSYLQGA